jgi:hypothetical protein
MKTLRQTFTRWLALAGLLLAMAGCATGQSAKLVNHSFNFDGSYDGWKQSIDLLEYSYGDQYLMVRRKAAEGDTLGAQAGVSGPMPVGDFLYVRWRLKSSGEQIEQRVDLRDRIPKDMTDHELTFVLEGRQLFVYVVTPDRKKAYGEPPVLRTWRSNFAKAYEIYPNR